MVTLSGCDPQVQKEHEANYLHNLLHQGLVCAGFGSLQPADVLADPRDQGELGPLAHGIPSGEAHNGEESDIICSQQQKEGIGFG